MVGREPSGSLPTVAFRDGLTRMRRSLTVGATVAVVVTVLLAGCGDDEGPDTSDDPTSTSTTRADAAPDEVTTGAGADGYVIDEAVLRPSIEQTEKLLGGPGGLDGVDDEDYRAVVRAACAEVRSGFSSGREPDATAEAAAAAIPDGPSERRYVPAALVATELYLDETSCGTDAAYAASVREALHPLANEAFLDAARGA